MPEVKITVGGREYRVACGAGEEAHLTKAAERLNVEAERLAASGQALPENTVLLMAGLMVADTLISEPTVTPEADAEAIAALEKKLETAKSANAALNTRLADALAAADAAPAADGALAEKLALMTEERDAARGEAKALKEQLDKTEAAAPAGLNGDHAVLERMAAELERLADEMEAGGIRAKAS